jgi:photosystem II stability/assembly factor-like uncharacterized protein
MAHGWAERVRNAVQYGGMTRTTVKRWVLVATTGLVAACGAGDPAISPIASQGQTPPLYALPGAMAFTDAEHGWMAVDVCSPNLSRAPEIGDLCGTRVLATSDGGVSWAPVSRPPLQALTAGHPLGAAPLPPLADLAFSSLSTGFMAHGKVRTTDGGHTWLDVPSLQAVDPEGIAVSGTDAWAVINTCPQQAESVCLALVHSVDGGTTWSRPPAQPRLVQELSNSVELVYSDPQTLWVLSSATSHEQSIMSVTLDGGASWGEVPNACPQQTQYGETMSVLGKGDVWVVCGQVGDAFPGDIRESSNLGQHWETRGSVASLQSVVRDFVVSAPGHLWLTVWDRGAAATYLYGVAAGGAPEISVSAHNVVQVDFVDAAHGWALASPPAYGTREPQLWRTVDGGSTWQSEPVIWTN